MEPIGSIPLPAAVPTPEHASAPLGAKFAVAAFGLGLWLITSPFLLGFGVTSTRLGGWNNAVVVGAVVLVVALGGMMAPADTPWFGHVLALLGAWVVVCPLVLGYHEKLDPARALLNHAVSGAALLAVGVGAVLAMRRRRR
ncbi:SPW repeat domain-containing protein [Actinosynnema pretiosum]|uniref:SPW repeat-containing integral membrane domain-containing protein n=1 Tax=Actinosynnema pretiosum TaxID=42197 RepID=A0A290Z8B6_9PSEU|nr:SPW repeat protein [Actinosynnema pretiosum]ATE55260.1 hypothetical protein CNX65_19860 [Actinosynnema pretiosum]